jgi:hypothetical protein
MDVFRLTQMYQNEIDDILASPDDEFSSQSMSQRSVSDNALGRRPDDKVKKFFGEEVAVAAKRRDTTIGPLSAMSSAPSAIGAPSNLGTGEIPWYLGYDYTPNDIVFNMEGQVKGGTLTALVERLTLHDFLGEFDNIVNRRLLLCLKPRSLTPAIAIFSL